MESTLQGFPSLAAGCRAGSTLEGARSPCLAAPATVPHPHISAMGSGSVGGQQ